LVESGSKLTLPNFSFIEAFSFVSMDLSRFWLDLSSLKGHSFGLKNSLGREEPSVAAMPLFDGILSLSFDGE